jgi:hypothetical protein
MLAHVVGEHARIKIINIAGREPDHNSNRFTLKERSLRLKIDSAEKQNEKCASESIHIQFLSSMPFQFRRIPGQPIPASR